MPQPSKPMAVIAIAAPVSVEAASGEGESAKPAKFSTEFYTGGLLPIAGWEHPVVVDLAGLTTSKVLVANLDHEQSKRVGNFQVHNDGTSLNAVGTATASTAARDEVVNSARDGYQWQSSLEVSPSKVEFVKAGQTAEANGQTFEGPIYIARKGTLKGFAFVSHGADDNTTVTIAATADSTRKVKNMNQELKAWIEGTLNFDVETLSTEQIEGLTANFNGQQASKAKPSASNPFEARKLEAKRRNDIRSIADKLLDRRESEVEEIEAIEAMVEHAIEAGMTSQDFRLELYESAIPQHQKIKNQPHTRGMSEDVLAAALCQAGRLPDHEKMFNEQTLEAAHKEFRDGIGLKQIFLTAAEFNGHRTGHSGSVTRDVMRAAFPNQSDRPAIRGAGFSTIDIANVVSNVANKFIRVGWNAVDLTCLRIAAVRPVRDYKQTTTVSLTGDLTYEKLGAAGEIKHGTLGEVAYNNQADLYAKMLGITEVDIVNDDLSALTTAQQRLGRGAALKLNDVFWTAFLNNSAFFTSGRLNVNEGVADMTIGGLSATETIFMNQTDPDGKPLGVMPKIILVPTALKATATALMAPQSTLITGASATLSNVNVFAGRFVVESSPYMANSSYTGYSAAAWYMLADPSEMPVVEIVALNGRVEPIVESADADFNTLGVQMRGKSSIGVALQEYRGGVRADGGAS